MKIRSRDVAYNQRASIVIRSKQINIDGVIVEDVGMLERVV